MPETLKAVLLLFPFLYELIKESIDFIVRKKPDDHKKSTVIRMALIFSLSGFVALWHSQFGYLVGLIQCLVFSSFMFALFDPFLNLIRRHIGKHKHVHFFYYGQSDTDEKLKNWHPAVQVFVRLWVITAAVIIYSRFDLILYGY